MVYYKKRYAKRRGTTRYRRRTYRTRRTPYRRRRFYNKANKAEWKQTSPVASLLSLTIPASTYGTSLTLNMSNVNSMGTGANPGQRIGRKLNANFLKLRWHVDLVDTQIDSFSIRFFAIQVKGNPNASPSVAPYRPEDIITQLEYGAGDSKWQLGVIAPFKDGITNSCRILFDKTYKLNANSTTSQLIFKRKIRMQPLIWETATDSTYNIQASNPVFLYWVVVSHSPPNNAVAVPINSIYRLVYTDS